MCRSRIDFMLSKRESMEFIDKIFYKESFYSDHKMLWVEIDMSKRGPGWVMDVKYRDVKK